MRKLSFSLVFAVLASLSSMAQATLINNNNGTFTDTATGYKWQQIDTFFNLDAAGMSGKLLAGFHFATLEELETLQSAAPAQPSTFAADHAVMGGSDTRALIWGAYGDLNTYSWKFSHNSNWNFSPHFGNAFADMGAFAVNTTVDPSSVPEPASLALFGLGALGFAAARRRKQ